MQTKLNLGPWPALRESQNKNFPMVDIDVYLLVETHPSRTSCSAGLEENYKLCDRNQTCDGREFLFNSSKRWDVVPIVADRNQFVQGSVV